MKKIEEEISNKTLLLAMRGNKYTKIAGDCSLEACLEKIGSTIICNFFWNFLQNAVLSNKWKNGENHTLFHNNWNKKKDILCITFVINKTRCISGATKASFTLRKVDIINKIDIIYELQRKIQ